MEELIETLKEEINSESIQKFPDFMQDSIYKVIRCIPFKSILEQAKEYKKMSIKDFNKIVEIINQTTSKHIGIDYDKFEEDYQSNTYEAQLTSGQIIVLEEIIDALEDGQELLLKIGYKAQ